MFQSTPLREGRRLISFLVMPAQVVSIHAPARGATIFFRILHLLFLVSIHAPARGATISAGLQYSYDEGFNPRPCARGDNKLLQAVKGSLVSIHAPARGATLK